MSETARKTKNGGWCPDGPVSRKIGRSVVELKALVRPGMSVRDLELATAHCNVILYEAQRVAEMETSLPVVVLCATEGVNQKQKWKQ